MREREKASSRPGLVVGRAAEVEYLAQCLEAALRGERQVVFVSGEPGIGKTTVVDTFLAQLQERADLQIGHGQCIEHYGAGEAYLPLLEVGTRMCRGSGGEQVVALLRQYAPSWLVQLPGVLPEGEWEQLSRRVQGTTRERMLREAAEAVVQFTRERGYVLVLEDLHWSDVSTLEWLSYIALRREAAKLLLIGTYRPAELLVSGHPLRGVVQELIARGRSEELRVEPLSAQDVHAYLRARLSGAPLASTLPGLIHRRTGGNPLFMVTMVEYLAAQGVLQAGDGQWDLRGDLQAGVGGVPDSLRQLIERQLERLPEAAQQVLAVASVAGMEFSAAVVAAGLQAEVEAVEARCDELVRQGQFLRAEGTEEWPDGTLSERYSFRHALYRDVLYERLAETRRARLHRRIGEWREAAYGERAGVIAAELAMHFEQGRDYQKAIEYHYRAGENAVRRSVHREAVAHLTQGLELLSLLPDTPQRTRHELNLQLTLGPALMATKGATAPEVEQAYVRAQALCQQGEGSPYFLQALYGLWTLYHARGELRAARELGEQCLRMVQHGHDPAPLLLAHFLFGNTLFWRGELDLGRRHLEQSVALFSAQFHGPQTVLYQVDHARIMTQSLVSLVLWMLGYPDQAVVWSQGAVALAQERQALLSLAYALTLAALFRAMRREGLAAQEQTQAALSYSSEQGFPQIAALGMIAQGYLLTEQGQREAGLAQMYKGLAARRAAGAQLGQTVTLAFLAESYKKGGQAEEGLRVLAEALAEVDKREERFYEAELYRLKGELTLQSQTSPGQVKASQNKSVVPNTQYPTPSTRAEAEAEACFHKALEVARQQQAKSLELRAATSLARLWQQQDRAAEARELLESIYGWFTEGFDTKDLQEAEALLAALGGQVARKPQAPVAEHSVTITLPSFAPSSQDDPCPPPPVPSERERAIVTPREERVAQPLAQLRGDDSALLTTAEPVFRQEGEYWTVAFAGTVRRIRDIRGLRYLAHLLAHPHEEIHVLTLAAEGPAPWENEPTSGTTKQSAADRGMPEDSVLAGFTAAGEVLDPQARAAYRQRLLDLQAELDEAQAYHDVGRIEKLQAEVEFLTRELSQAVGLGGRPRKVVSAAERARINVTKAIKMAIRRISRQHPALGQHLAQAVKTGTFCVYEPKPPQSPSWQR